jgi:UPF0716 protein FxsA
MPRRPALLPVAALILLVVEIAAIVLVGRQIGALWTVLLLIAGSAIGGLVLRREGVRAWRAFVGAIGEGRPPHRETLDGILILLGGLLIVFPGFVSDLLGLLVLLPPTRAVVRRAGARYLDRRTGVLRVRARRTAPPARSPGDHPGNLPGDQVVEGEIAGPPDPDA